METVLEVRNLTVHFDTPSGPVQAVRDVSFSLHKGEVLAIVGESGCGKSVLCRSILKLLPDTARLPSGTILVNGVDIIGYGEREMTKLRGKLFSMVFQDPMTALDPTMTIGAQIAEAVRVHQPRMGRETMRQRVLELMTLVGIERPAERMGLYPHNFSGGMRQRSVLAMALAGDPAILFADEPTTALDVTIQAQILDLLRQIQQQLGTATVFVTHDLGAVARVADRVAVMYAGKIVEIGTAEEIFYDPRHPYTWGLLGSMPSVAQSTNNAKSELMSIPGSPPDLFAPPKGCAFAARCPYAMTACQKVDAETFTADDGHMVRCWLMDSRAPAVTPPVGRAAVRGKEAKA